MGGFLKSGAINSFELGPVLDVTNKNPQTTLTPGSYTAAVIKPDGTRSVVTPGSGGDSLAHLADGYWWATLNADLFDQVGNFNFYMRSDSVFLDIPSRHTVLPADVYDAIIAGNSLLKTNLMQVGSSTQTLDQFKAGVDCNLRATVLAGTWTTTEFDVQLIPAASLLTDTPKGLTFKFRTGPNQYAGSRVGTFTPITGGKGKITVAQANALPAIAVQNNEIVIY